MSDTPAIFHEPPLPCFTPDCEGHAVGYCEGNVQYEHWGYEVTWGIQGHLEEGNRCGAPLCLACMLGDCWLCGEPRPWPECEICGRPEPRSLCRGCERYMCSWCDPDSDGFCTKKCERQFRKRREEPTLFEQLPF